MDSTNRTFTTIESIDKSFKDTVGVIDGFDIVDCDNCRDLLNELLSPHLSYSP